MKGERRLSKTSVGEFNPSEWKSEGNSLLLSSRLLRARWLLNRRELLKRLRDKANFSNVQTIHADLRLIEIDKSLFKSSILLVGYAVEMFLKAGLARAVVGCEEEIFTFLSRKKFGHDYVSLANFLKYPLTDQSRQDLNALSAAVQRDARYPISLGEGDNYIDQINKRRQRLSDGSNYKRYCALANDIAAYAVKLAGTQANPLSTGSYQVDDDGYIAYLRGGPLTSRISFKLSSRLKKEPNPRYLLKKIAVSEIPFLNVIWASAEIYEHIAAEGVKYKRLCNDSFMPASTLQAPRHGA